MKKKFICADDMQSQQHDRHGAFSRFKKRRRCGIEGRWNIFHP